MKIKKSLAIKIMAGLIIASAISFSTYSAVDAKMELKQTQKNTELQTVSNAAKTNYKNDTVLGLQPPEIMYLVVRQSADKEVKLSLYIDGLFVEMGSMGVLQEAAK